MNEVKLRAKYRRALLRRKRTPEQKALDQAEKDAYRMRWVQWVKAHSPATKDEVVDYEQPLTVGPIREGNE